MNPSHSCRRGGESGRLGGEKQGALPGRLCGVNSSDRRKVSMLLSRLIAGIAHVGMRVNNLLKVHKWLPVARAMPRTIKELYRQPELGFIHSEKWFAPYDHPGAVLALNGSIAGVCEKQECGAPACVACLQQVCRHGRRGWNLARDILGLARNLRERVCQHAAVRSWEGRHVATRLWREAIRSRQVGRWSAGCPRQSLN